jgi:predicted ribosome quality control (RQC) complex YloA/Tae2 family protein
MANPIRSSSSSSQSTGQGKLDNITYNVITVLHEKSKGLEAYDKYLQDVQGNDEVKQIFEEIRQQDEQSVQRLQDVLRTLLAGGESGERAA